MILSVVLWLWNDGVKRRWGGYTVEHVNRAAAMIRANLDMPHELVCITDQPEGDFRSDIRIVPIWDDLADRGRCWRRLKLFDPDTARSIGDRIAWIDIDCCVTGDLTPLFDRREDIVFWRSQTTRCPINGSMVLMTAGARPQVWTQFRPKQPFAPRYPGSDQAWISHVLNLGARPGDEAYWTRQDGVLSYVKYGRGNRQEPPTNSRIVFFPGSLKSNADVVLANTPWVQDILDQYGECSEELYSWVPRRTRLQQRGRQARAARPQGKRRGVWVRSWA